MIGIKANDREVQRMNNLAIDFCYVQEVGQKSKLHERDLLLDLMSRL